MPPHARSSPSRSLAATREGGLEVEPFDFGAQTTEKEGVNVAAGAPRDANDALKPRRELVAARSADRRLGILRRGAAPLR